MKSAFAASLAALLVCVVGVDARAQAPARPTVNLSVNGPGGIPKFGVGASVDGLGKKREADSVVLKLVGFRVVQVYRVRPEGQVGQAFRSITIRDLSTGDKIMEPVTNGIPDNRVLFNISNNRFPLITQAELGDAEAAAQAIANSLGNSAYGVETFGGPKVELEFRYNFYNGGSYSFTPALKFSVSEVLPASAIAN